MRLVKSLALSAAVLSLALGAGCGGKKKSAKAREAQGGGETGGGEAKTGGGEAKTGGGEAKTGGGEQTPPPAGGGTGSIAGSVAFTGTAPVMPDIDRAADPFCAKTPMKAETVVVNGNNTLRDVLVRIKPGTIKGQAPAEPLMVKQHECMYRPRVQGVVDGQMLKIENTDDTTHNVHAFDMREGEGEESLYNLAQPKGSADIEKETSGYQVIKLKCDVHPWMLGYVVVSDNGFFAVTDDQGNFKIDNVPAGDYEVEAWHAQYGMKTAKVTVAKDTAADPKLSYDGNEKPL